MTLIRHPAPKLRLSQLLRRPGGITVSEALERAETGLAEIADPCRQALDLALAKAEAAERALGADPGDERSLRALYAAADEMVGLAGPAGQVDVGTAAYSLCELVDRALNGGTLKPAAVRVHLDALTLLRRDTAGEGVRRAVLEGLAQVARR